LGLKGLKPSYYSILLYTPLCLQGADKEHFTFLFLDSQQEVINDMGQTD